MATRGPSAFGARRSALEGPLEFDSAFGARRSALERLLNDPKDSARTVF